MNRSANGNRERTIYINGDILVERFGTLHVHF